MSNQQVNNQDQTNQPLSKDDYRMRMDSAINAILFAVEKLDYLDSKDPTNNTYNEIKEAYVQIVLHNQLIHNNIVRDQHIEIESSIKEIRELFDNCDKLS